MLRYKAREYRDKTMGIEPTPNRLTDIIVRIELEIERLKNSDRKNPMIGFLETFLRDSRELLEMWNKERARLAAMRAKKARQES
jgi:hypothetical protein